MRVVQSALGRTTTGLIAGMPTTLEILVSASGEILELRKASPVWIVRSGEAQTSPLSFL